ncbi:putative fluoride ion transporter CrcB [Arenicella chitinivorans]|uniref:Fluoride-specific ion channel FluC n=1 Tax=Arenicella chitinivorans TaxID=1329800 RepID=A0A918RTX3_9GAMM|nr:fluoride efflux transporter CrcB [Arenicella chitinivorans]GHA08276.1 putative fluoride ion transporter CrcB [Arenicella chitinivorans]
MLLYIGIIVAGGLGALLRFLVGRVLLHSGWAALPLSTLAVNAVGSFLMGYLSWLLVHKWSASPHIQWLVMTGFLGGFTTFSAFSLETVVMMEQGAELRALFYVLSQVLLCVSLCWVGIFLARHS